jgi:hypothetical protein
MKTVNELRTALILACVELNANNSLWVPNGILFKPSNPNIVSVVDHDGKYLTVTVTDTTVSHKHDMLALFPEDPAQYERVMEMIKSAWE